MIDFEKKKKGSRHFQGVIITCPKCNKKGLSLWPDPKGRVNVCHKGVSLLGGAGLSLREFCTYNQFDEEGEDHDTKATT